MSQITMNTSLAEQEIRKKTEMLARLDKSRVILSSRDALVVGKKKEEPEPKEPSPPPKVCGYLCLDLVEK